VRTGHTAWSDGNTHETGMTTAWTPNRAINSPAAGGADVDLSSKLIVQGGPTYVAIVARSFHPSGVNALMGDGSVRFIKSGINGVIWRGLGTIKGGEVIRADAY